MCDQKKRCCIFSNWICSYQVNYCVNELFVREPWESYSLCLHVILPEARLVSCVYFEQTLYVSILYTVSSMHITPAGTSRCDIDFLKFCSYQLTCNRTHKDMKYTYSKDRRQNLFRDYYCRTVTVGLLYSTVNAYKYTRACTYMLVDFSFLNK